MILFCIVINWSEWQWWFSLLISPWLIHYIWKPVVSFTSRWNYFFLLLLSSKSAKMVSEQVKLFLKASSFQAQPWIRNEKVCWASCYLCHIQGMVDHLSSTPIVHAECDPVAGLWTHRSERSLSVSMLLSAFFLLLRVLKLSAKKGSCCWVGVF